LFGLLKKTSTSTKTPHFVLKKHILLRLIQESTAQPVSQRALDLGRFFELL